MKKVINNKHFNLYQITAVLNEEYSDGIYDGQLTVYSVDNGLLDILMECEPIADLMDCYSYTIEKDWNDGDIIIIKIYYYSVIRPTAIQGLL